MFRKSLSSADNEENIDVCIDWYLVEFNELRACIELRSTRVKQLSKVVRECVFILYPRLRIAMIGTLAHTLEILVNRANFFCESTITTAILNNIFDESEIDIRLIRIVNNSICTI